MKFLVSVRFTNGDKTYSIYFDNIINNNKDIIGVLNNQKIKIANIDQRAINFKLGKIIEYNSVYIYPEFKKLIGAQDVETDEAWYLIIRVL